MSLSSQQRAFLAQATVFLYVAAPMFADAYRTPHAAQAVLRRLARRGLLAQDELNPAIFRITDAGREALA